MRDRYRRHLPGIFFIAAALCAVTGLWQLSKSRTLQLCGELVSHVETTAPMVALTFDDGPAPAYLDDVLDALRAHEARATFFLTGREVEARPQLARRLLAEGHELGNHSYTHSRLVLRSPDFVADQLTRTDRALRQVGQEGEIWFRPPYGKKLLVLPWLLRRAQRPTVMWDLAPDDDPRRSAEEIARRALDEMRPGSIVLMHVMYRRRQTSRDALPMILAGMQRRGLRAVTVSELLGHRETDGGLTIHHSCARAPLGAVPFTRR